ncbi:glycosyltransferase [Variovorax boronicumulans]|uniref:glycosyltransferase n=1 Tax=Variovorax boronicumulans TaxID=436515 RepID=UPI0012E664FD|nr:glycosyltransferase [Variovorax boronicumulans]GER19495.1 glycosyl transferase [Variovorax boronicumulans]
MKIAHLTSAHKRYDTRIFIKQCRSLAAAGENVSLLVADDLGDEVRDGVQILDVGAARGRLNRMLKVPLRIYRKAVELDATVYHLHDPELLFIGLRLLRIGKKVVFDAHEDVPKQILSKPYLNKAITPLLSNVYSLFERYACSRLTGIITATPFIRDKFLKVNPQTLDINNFPLLSELGGVTSWEEKKNEVCYIGGISVARGAVEIVNALQFINSDVRLNLAGNFIESDLREKLKQSPGWPRVSELGFLNRVGVRQVLDRSLAGLVTLHPLENYLDALPVKMFEYMAAGIPPVASNFPLWRKIIEEADCGLCVNPKEPREIAEALDYLLKNPAEAKRLGDNGRKAAVEKYNWEFEELKLLRFYKDVLKC